MNAAKSVLNELYQRLRTSPVYATQQDAAQGQDGFICGLTLPPVDEGIELLRSARSFSGRGSTKKEAEHAAAAEAVAWLRTEGLLGTDGCGGDGSPAASGLLLPPSGGSALAAVGCKRSKEDDSADTLEQRILEALVAVHPKALTGAQLAKMCGHFKLKSKVNHLLYVRLRSHGLVEMLDASPPPAWRAAPAVLRLAAEGAERLAPPPSATSAGGGADGSEGGARDGGGARPEVTSSEGRDAGGVEVRAAAAGQAAPAPEVEAAATAATAAAAAAAATGPAGQGASEAAVQEEGADVAALGRLLEAIPQRLVIDGAPGPQTAGRSPWAALADRPADSPANTQAGSRQRGGGSHALSGDTRGSGAHTAAASLDTATSSRRAATAAAAAAAAAAVSPAPSTGSEARLRGASPRVQQSNFQQQPQQQQQQRWRASAQRGSPAASTSGGGSGSAAGAAARDLFPSTKPASKYARTGQSSRHRLGSQQHLQQLVELQQQQLIQLQQLLTLQQSQALGALSNMQIAGGGSVGIGGALPVEPLMDASVDQVAALLQRQLLQPGSLGGAVDAASLAGLAAASGGSGGGAARAPFGIAAPSLADQQRAAAAAAAFGGLGSSFAGMGLGGSEGSGGGGAHSSGGAYSGGVASGRLSNPTSMAKAFSNHGGPAPGFAGLGSPAAAPAQAGLHPAAAGFGVGGPMAAGLAAMFAGADGFGGAFGSAGFGGWHLHQPSPSVSRGVSLGAGGGAHSAATGAPASPAAAGQDPLLDDHTLSPAVLAAASEAAALEPAPVAQPVASGRSGGFGGGAAAAAGDSLSSHDPVDAAPRGGWHPMSDARLTPAAIGPRSPEQQSPSNAQPACSGASGPAAAPLRVAPAAVATAAADAGTSVPKAVRGAGETGIKRKAPADSAPMSSAADSLGGARPGGRERRGSGSDAGGEPPAPIGRAGGVGASGVRRRRGAASSRPHARGDAAGAGAMDSGGTSSGGSSSGGGGGGGCGSGGSGDEGGGKGAATSCANSSIAGGAAAAAAATTAQQQQQSQVRLGSSRGAKSSRVEQHPGLGATQPAAEAPQGGSSVGTPYLEQEQALLLLSRLQLPVSGAAAGAAAPAAAAPAAAADLAAPGVPPGLPSELRVEYERRVDAVREALAELRRFELMHAEGGGAAAAGQGAADAGGAAQGQG